MHEDGGGEEGSCLTSLVSREVRKCESMGKSLLLCRDNSH